MSEYSLASPYFGGTYFIFTILISEYSPWIESRDFADLNIISIYNGICFVGYTSIC